MFWENPLPEPQECILFPFPSCNSPFPASQIEYKQRGKFWNGNSLTQRCQGNQVAPPTKEMTRCMGKRTLLKSEEDVLLVAASCLMFLWSKSNKYFIRVFYLSFLRRRRKTTQRNLISLAGKDKSSFWSSHIFFYKMV